MDKSKKYNEREYISWLINEVKVPRVLLDERYYNEITQAMKKTFMESNLWLEIKDNYREIGSNYELMNKGYKLYQSEELPEIKLKGFKSYINKTYRKNILHNENYPEEPDGGWYIPNRTFDRIKDTVRTLFVVKYMDGVPYLTNRLEEIIDKHNKDIKCEASLEAKMDEGYYAAHIDNICCVFEVPDRVEIGTIKIKGSIEIQITTQIQEVIRKLLHKYYDEKKEKIGKLNNENWRWNSKNDIFSVNYLGHILHYIEGMIVEIRDKKES